MRSTDQRSLSSPKIHLSTHSADYSNSPDSSASADSSNLPRTPTITLYQTSSPASIAAT